MPIFEYVCNECGNGFEKIVTKSEAISCPKCSTEKVTKQFSRFGFSSSGKGESLPIYKGGGCGCTPSSCGCKH